MCYLENLWPVADFAVQSNTFSFTYANFLQKNYPQAAHLTLICAENIPFWLTVVTSKLQIIMKYRRFCW
jgi:hypothetical protein